MPFWRIPQELQDVPQWVCWRIEERTNAKGETKQTKTPVNVSNGSYASVTDPATWATFAAAVAFVGQSDTVGIGFVFTVSCGIAGIDLDDAKGNVDLLVAHNRIIAAFPSYSEISPSGKGLHIIVRGKIQGARKHGVEAYSTERFFTFTGNVWRDLPITDCQSMLTELQAELAPARTKQALLSTCPQLVDDQTIINRMMAAANADKVRQLVNGSGVGIGDSSGSAVDMALVNILQFYTKNVAQIERLWLSTPHAQDRRRLQKLKRYDYRMRTIRQAFDREPPQVDMAGLHATWAAEAATKAGAAAVLSGATGAGEAVAGSSGQAELVAPMPLLSALPRLATAPGIQEPSQHQTRIPPSPGNSRAATPAPAVSAKGIAKSNPYVLPPGLLGSVAQFIYDAAPRQVPEIALAGAIGLMGGICGRAYNIHGDGLNVYIALLASSGSGKEAVSNGYSALQTALLPSSPCFGEFIGPANFASVQGLLRFINKQASAVSVVGEFGGWLHDMIGDRANPVRVSLKMALLEVYGKSGKKGVYRATEYSAKDNNIAAVTSPALSIVGETTPSTFYRAITQATIEDGFLPRFILIEYEGKNAYHNEASEHVTVPPQLVADLAQLAGHCLTLNAPARDGGPKPGPIAVGMMHDAKRQLDAFSRYCTDRSNDTDNEGIKNVWARVYINAVKLAGLVAVGCNAVEPKITLEHAEWAMNLVAHSCNKLTGKVDSGDVAGDAEGKQYNDLLRCLREITTYTGDKYRLPIADAKNYFVNTAWLNARVSKLSSYRMDRMGATYALRRAIARATSEDIMYEDKTKQDTRGPGGTRYTVFMQNISIDHIAS